MSKASQQETVFTVIIETQTIRVRYRPDHIGGRDPHAILEFSSTEQPRRSIPVSQSGYRTFFAPMREIEAAPSVQIYACMVAVALAGELAASLSNPRPSTRM